MVRPQYQCSTMARHHHLILIPVIILLLLPRTYAQFETAKPEDVTNKTTLLSATRPIANAIEPHKDLLIPLLNHISFISQAAQTSATAARQNTTTPLTTTCNYRNSIDSWNPDVERYFNQRSWGVVDDDCVTDVYGAGVKEGVGIVGSDNPGSDSRTVFQAVLEHAGGVDSVAKTAAKNAGLNWPDATRATGFGHSVRTQTCRHDYAGFVRRGGDWYVAERVTNHEKDLTLGEGPDGDGRRLFIHEYIRISDGKLINAELEVRLKGTEFDFGRGTTAITEDIGPVTGSEFGEIFAPDNIAVREALRAGEHSTQQASDATTPSNIAILAFPLAMNVVPVALIADVNTVGMLVYTLLTDVLTTIPLLIKGVEVLSIGVDTNVAVVTRVTGANVEDDANKAGEVWVAECRANGDLTATGVVLIVVSVGFMVCGVIAEIVARKWVKRRGSTIGGKASAGLVMAGVGGTGRGKGGNFKNV